MTMRPRIVTESCVGDLQNENPEIPFMCFRVAFVHSMSYIFIIYCPENDDIVMIDKIGEKIDNILSDYSSSTIYICGDFNIPNKEWLAHTNITDEEGKYCHHLSNAYRLTQLVFSI